MPVPDEVKPQRITLGNFRPFRLAIWHIVKARSAIRRPRSCDLAQIQPTFWQQPDKKLTAGFVREPRPLAMRLEMFQNVTTDNDRHRPAWYIDHDFTHGRRTLHSREA